MNTPHPNPTRIGILGMGEHMVRAHLAHLVDRPDIELVSWFDPKLEVAANLPDTFKKVPCEEDLYDNPDIDAIMIGSPDKYHVYQLVDSIEAGKHVFCEKPMFEDFQGMIEVGKIFGEAKEKGLIISTCHPRRFDPPILAIRSLLNDPEWMETHLGTLKTFEFNFWYHEVTDEWKKNRSLLLDHFGHEIDTFRFLFPHLEEKNDDTHWNAKLISDSYDHYYVQICTRGVNGINAIFRGFRSLSDSVYQETIRLLGTKGSVVINLNEGCVFFERSGRYKRIPQMNYEVRFKAVNDDFIDAIRKKTPPYLNHDDMIKNNYAAVHLRR